MLAIADELYALSLEQFTPARDALVKEHKADKELAASIKALKKPSVAAWVVNLFVRRDPDRVAQLLQVGEALREAQATLDADQLREFTRQRRQLTAAVTTDARRVAREEGLKVTQAVADQVEATLTAAMLDEGAAQAVRSGLLVTPLAATGIEAVDVGPALAVPEALGFEAATREPEPTPRPELHVVPDPEADLKARHAADERVAAAEAAVAAARTDLDAAASDVAELEARVMQLQAEIDELRRLIAEKEAALEEVDDELGDAEDVKAEASDALRGAERELEAARKARARLP
ncbi:hypothetical protein DDE18_10410 [Nocardioides gansuensis]|uniref:Uncharacterized protein n=1 Tax=Nocardioides gansuensis TaxID=2138300 RepID=A0A2T8FBD6_9ACTN|nr:hypothetical protein DDE18_10410 [Nocardioides gansuensis]